MKPPDKPESSDDPDRHDGQVRLAGEGLAEGQHDEGNGQYAEDEQNELNAIEAFLGWWRLGWRGHLSDRRFLAHVYLFVDRVFQLG
jgi:hypothetical protein